MATLLALADIIVVNYALHYTQGLDHYEREMRKMFEQVADFAKTPGKARNGLGLLNQSLRGLGRPRLGAAS